MALTSNREELIEALRAGPLRLDDWASFAKSRASLKARVCYLRKEGFRIITETIPGSGTRSGQYVLTGEPS